MAAVVALLTALALVGTAVPASAHPGPEHHYGIVDSIVKAPIDPVGDVAGEVTDLVINLDRSLDPSVEGRGLLAGGTIKVTLPEQFEYVGGPVDLPGPPPLCPPPAGTCGAAVMLQGWPQNPIPPSPANYTVGLEGTHTVVFTASRDLVPGDPTLNGPGIKQLHLILNNFVNPAPGRYEIEVVAETGPGGAVEKGASEVRIRKRPRASINVTSVFAGPAPFANTIYQTTSPGAVTPFDWDFLVWDRQGEPAVDVTVEQLNRRRAVLKRGDEVIGRITIRAPRGARGQEISGGPSVLTNAPVKGLPTGRLTVQFKAGDAEGVYKTTLRMKNGTRVTMYVTAVAP